MFRTERGEGQLKRREPGRGKKKKKRRGRGQTSYKKKELRSGEAKWGNILGNGSR